MLQSKEIRKIVAQSSTSMTSEAIAEMAIPSYVHWNPAVRWIIRKRLQVIATSMRERGVNSYLDFGCGVGILFEEMAQFCKNVYVSDVFLEPARQLIRSRQIKNVRPVDPSDLARAIPEGSLDSVVAADVLEHVDEVPAYLNLFAKLLRPGGILYLSGPTETVFYRLCRTIAAFKGDYHLRDVRSIENMLFGLKWKRENLIEIPPIPPFQLFRVSVWQIPSPGFSVSGVRKPRGHVR